MVRLRAARLRRRARRCASPGRSTRDGRVLCDDARRASPAGSRRGRQARREVAASGVALRRGRPGRRPWSCETTYSSPSWSSTEQPRTLPSPDRPTVPEIDSSLHARPRFGRRGSAVAVVGVEVRARRALGSSRRGTRSPPLTEQRPSWRVLEDRVDRPGRVAAPVAVRSLEHVPAEVHAGGRCPRRRSRSPPTRSGRRRRSTRSPVARSKRELAKGCAVRTPRSRGGRRRSTNGLSAGIVYALPCRRRGVDAQQLAEQGVERLPVAAGRVARTLVAGRAAVAHPDRRACRRGR